MKHRQWIVGLDSANPLNQVTCSVLPVDIYWLYNDIHTEQGMLSLSAPTLRLTSRCQDHYTEIHGLLGKHGVNHPSFQIKQCSGMYSRSSQYRRHCYGQQGAYCTRSMFPGLGTAIVAFTAYVIYDDFIAAKPKHDSHGHGSGH